MNRWKPVLLRGALETMYFSGIHRLLGSVCGGVGAIFTLHHVVPEGDVAPFAPNHILDITPQFLERTIHQIRALGYEFASLDRVRQRLLERNFDRKFVCFTLDDGYLDNLTHAVPIFEKLEVPYTIYVTTGMPDGDAILWWQHLEDIVREHDEVVATVGERQFALKSKTLLEKFQAFGAIYWSLRSAPHEVQQAAIRDMLATYDVSARELCSRSAIGWALLKELAASDLATIGAHTVNHYALRKLSDEALRNEIVESRRILAQRLGNEPQHFSYPFGDPSSAGPREFDVARDLGFATATTTRKGVLFAEHADHLHALPRVSLNGDYQKARYVSLFLSGAPFALMNRFRRLDVQ